MTPHPPTTVGAYISDALKSEIPKEYWQIPPEGSTMDRIRGFSNALLHGSPGTGKTAFLWALYGKMRKEQMAGELEDLTAQVVDETGDRVLFRDKSGKGGILASANEEPPMRIISEPVDIMRHRYDRAWIDEVSSFIGVMAIDDIGAIGKSDWLTEALYGIADVRRARKLRTLWASNLNPRQIAAAFSPAIASRICGGAIVEVSGKDRRAS